MREESEDKKVMTVSEEWRKKHEGRMKMVGVVRTSSETGSEKEGKREDEEKMEEVRPLEKEKEKMTLGDGWGW